MARKGPMPFTVPQARIAALRKQYDCVQEDKDFPGYDLSQDVLDPNRVLLLMGCGIALFETAKQHSASKPNFQGSAVLVSSQVVAMQHRRTSSAGGVLETELISDDEAACWEHLRRVRREPKKR